MKALSIAAAALASVLCASCGYFVFVEGNGEVVAESRSIPQSGFDSIDVSGIGDVELIPSSDFGIELFADSNLMEYIETRVVFGSLYLGLKPGVSVTRYDALRFKVSMPRLRSVKSSGASRLRCAGAFVGDRIDIDLSGAGAVAFLGDYDEASIRSSGAGRIELAGSAAMLAIDSSGAGSVIASAYSVSDLDAKLSGAGSVIVRVERSLKADISGVGSLLYYGNPSKSVSISGLGRVTRL